MKKEETGMKMKRTGQRLGLRMSKTTKVAKKRAKALRALVHATETRVLR